MPTSVPVAIVGAGPYGLSIAAHLEASGVHYRIFGTPMRSWLEHMPERRNGQELWIAGPA